MSPAPSAEDIAKWNRWFAVELNNQAWTLAENPELTSAQREEMLHAAHAAAFHWSRIGTELHKARCDMLLGLVHALLGNGTLAMVYARRSQEYVGSHPSPDWEIALAHAVLAHAAYAAGDVPLHAKQYVLARDCGAAISDENDRAIFTSTFDRVPRP